MAPPLQYSCLENPMDGGAQQAAVHGVTKSRTRLSDFTFTFHFPALEKEMATHSSVLAWRIPGMGEPGGCRPWGHTESDTTESTQQQQQKVSSLKLMESYCPPPMETDNLRPGVYYQGIKITPRVKNNCFTLTTSLHLLRSFYLFFLILFYF